MSQFIAFSSKLDQEIDNLKELYLPCPRSSRRSVYFYNDQGRLYQVQKVTGPGRKGAWLLDSYIHKDGAVRFISALDPLFMALPILHQAYIKEAKFKTLEDIFSRENVQLEDGEQPIDVHRLVTIPGFIHQLNHLCDTQEVATDLFVYKLNEKSALDWLTKKVEVLLNNALFKASHTEQDDIKLEAVYTLSNYLNSEWFNKLLERLELSEPKEAVGDITNYATDSSPASFFKRVHPDEKLVDTPSKKKKPDVPRSLSKVNTKGMKPLTSFFTAKK